MTSLNVQLFDQWYSTYEKQILQDFITFLKFPSISADPHYGDACRQTANWLCHQLRQSGLEAVLWESPGLPVVFGSWLKAGKKAPTVLIYHHYDVQPVDPIELWKSDPFEPLVQGNQIYARGASDNKGQCFYTLTALKAFFQLAEKVGFNLKIFIEGEEESGGRGTRCVLEEKKEELKADYLLVVDCGMKDEKTPAMTLGIRGIITMDVECQNASIDLHSGLHGGIALNPNRVLATLLASLWDEKGRVAISGFYDDVISLSQEERALIDLEFDQKEYEKVFGVNAFANEKEVALKESNGLRPSLEINGMWGGYIGQGFKTVIPSHAFAKLSCRVVPNQDPLKVAHQIKHHLETRAPEGIKIKVDVHETSAAYRIDSRSSLVKIVSLSYEEVMERKCQYCLSGGSIPIVVDLAHASDAEVALIGMGLESDDIHAPNEHFGLDRFKKGYLSMAQLLTAFSEGRHAK